MDTSKKLIFDNLMAIFHRDAFFKSVFVLILFLVVALVGCSDPSVSESSVIDNPNFGDSTFTAEDSILSEKILGYGLVPVTSKYQSVFLGTLDENAAVMNRPQMKVSFSYNFGIMKHEVMKREYDELMLGASLGNSVWSSLDSIPITDVTYYDAVLFANAKSKSMGLDTVYTYSKTSFDASGNCIFLTGLVSHLDVFGFRLPTEAEWVLSANQGWDVSNGWTNDNSESALHPVCSLPANSLQLCDMAGNAAEWVNDWMGNLRDTVVTDYVGALNEGPRSERIIKGGSYINAASKINSYSRGDAYTVTSSKKANYIGFRLALGRIDNPFWMDDKGRASKSPLFPIASLADVFVWTGSYEDKVVFRNDVTGNLVYLDYASGTLSVTEFEDGLDAYHPDISPDGKRVAFCTGIEGSSGNSLVYVRNLDKGKSGLVRLDVPNAAIPRWRVSSDGDTSIVFVTDAGNNSEEAVWKQQSTWSVPFLKGAFGTPQKLFDGTFNGGVSADNRLAISGASLLRARRGNVDEIWYNGEQACNASLSTDGSYRTLFLDFGGATGRSFVGENYGVHQRILVVDSTGNLVSSVPAPAGMSYDHTEWVYGSNLAVATLVNADGAHKSVVLIDFSNSAMLNLMDGEELWHPSFWNKKKTIFPEDKVSFSIDSAGIYLYPGGDWIHENMRVKMEMMWRNYDKVEYLFVGSSRTENGLVPSEFTSGFAINMGYPGCELYSMTYLAENYGFNLMPKLKTVVLSLDIGLWHTVTYAYDGLFNTVPGYKYDRDHRFWADSVPTYFVDAVGNAYPAPEKTYKSLMPTYGYSKLESESWGELLIDNDSNWVDTQRDSLDMNLAILENFIKKSSEKGIEVIGIIFPQNPGYRKTGSFGRYGPARSRVPEIMDSLANILARNPNFHMMDENKMGNHDYSKKMAYNTDHLAFEGARQVTTRLDSLIKSLEASKGSR